MKPIHRMWSGQAVEYLRETLTKIAERSSSIRHE